MQISFRSPEGGELWVEDWDSGFIANLLAHGYTRLEGTREGTSLADAGPAARDIQVYDPVTQTYGGIEKMAITDPNPFPVSGIPEPDPNDIVQLGGLGSLFGLAPVLLKWLLGRGTGANIVQTGLAALGGAGLAGLLGGGGGGGGDGGQLLPGGLGFTPQNFGVPEPPAGMVKKQWKVFINTKTESYWIYFFALTDGRIALYNPRKGWSAWRPYRSIVIGKSLTTSNVLRVSRRLREHSKALSKVLKILK